MTTSTKRNTVRLAGILAVGIVGVAAMSAQATTYTWIKTAGGAQSWDVAANWNTDPDVPNPVSGDTVDFSTVNITANTTLTLGADRTAAIWKFGDINNGQSWTVNTGNKIILAGTTPTIQVDGSITTTLNCVLDGTAGLTKTGAGSLVFAGANTYSGGTTVNGGFYETIQVVATVALNNGPIAISNGARLTHRGDVNCPYPFSVGAGGGEIRNRGNGNSTITGILTGSDTLTYGDYGGSGARSYNFNSTENDFTGGIIISGGNYQTFQVNSLVDSANNIALDSSAAGQNTFRYGTGATNALILSQRAFELNAPGSMIGVIENQNTNQPVIIHSDLVASGAGAKNLTLTAATGPTNIFAGTITDGTDGGTVSLTKTGNGIWVLRGANTFSGPTTVSAGTLVLVTGASLSDTNVLSIASGKKVQLEAGVKEKVGVLKLNGIKQNDGIYGSSSSAAPAENQSAYFSGTGLLYVNIPLPASGTLISFH